MLLHVDNLAVAFRLPNGDTLTAVDGINFSIAPGMTTALVGESGCGKSVTAFSIMRLLPENGFHPTGRILFDGQELLNLYDREMRRIRGDDIAMIFQEPMTSLNPLMRIGRQICEPLQLHREMSREDAEAEALALLRKVGIPSPESRLRDFPHQMSGGMRQRIMIAMALACQPKLLIADEPTTALDVTIQAQILSLIRDLQQETNMAVLFITHDLGVVNQIADDVCVMYAGRIMEKGSREQVFDHMSHPYTRGLFASLPAVETRGRQLCTIPGTVPSLNALPSGCRFRDRCLEAYERCRQEAPANHQVQEGHAAACHYLDPNSQQKRDDRIWHRSRDRQETDDVQHQADLLTVSRLKTHFPVKRGVFMRTVAHVRAVDDVSFRVPQGSTMALVGESGCGKTTVGMSILRLIKEAEGTVVFSGENAMQWDRKRLRSMRSDLQIVFQDPFSSLSPRMTAGRIIGEGLGIHFPELSKKEQTDRILQALREVGLTAKEVDRYPHEFSGGQRQRISIARALVLKPKFIVLDEPTSALDVSVQAQILNLLHDLQGKYRLTYLFITHDLAVVRHMADMMAVMYLGRIVEYGPCESIFEQPLHPYTRSLLRAVPSTTEIRELVRLEGEVPSPLSPPTGCHFHPRCPLYAQSVREKTDLAETCRVNYPVLAEADEDENHRVACHAVRRSHVGIPRTGPTQT